MTNLPGHKINFNQKPLNMTNGCWDKFQAVKLRFIDGRENSKQSDIKEVEVSVGSSYNQASLQNIEKNKSFEITSDFIHNICTYNKHNYDSESTPTRTPPKRIHEPNVMYSKAIRKSTTIFLGGAGWSKFYFFKSTIKTHQ